MGCSPKDFVICEVFSTDDAECIDRAPSGGRSEPQPDSLGSDVDVTEVTTEGGWTTVTFLRAQASLDAQDYNIFGVGTTLAVHFAVERVTWARAEHLDAPTARNSGPANRT